jgi:bifunctional non-homologous end joining protein LigD
MAVRVETIRVGRLGVEITRPRKILFPADGITKRDLVDCYRRIGPWMLPHLRDRPLAMERCPDGIAGPSFFQKEVPSYYPNWIERVTVEKAGGRITHVVRNNEATLVYLANQACITPHIWLSRVEKLRCPTRWFSTWTQGSSPEWRDDPHGFRPPRKVRRSLERLSAARHFTE